MYGMMPNEKMAQFSSAPPLNKLKSAATPPPELCDAVLNHSCKTAGFTPGVLIAAGELSPVELTEAYLGRIESHNPALTAFVEVTAERARSDAKNLAAELIRGEWRGPLHGVPIGLKDLIDTAGIPTTAGSAAYHGRVPLADAAVARRLREAGTVLLGKLTTHELAYGVLTSNAKSYGTTKNPWNMAHIPGGSSGGAGAGIAARLTCAAVGTDTGGSIRVPASWCGCVGFKPTYGVVSRTGIAPLSWFFDHAGPLARTVTDAALVLDAISGYDPGDDASAPDAGGVVSVAASLQGDVRGLRVGVPRDSAWALLEPKVRDAAEAALGQLESLGMHLIEVELPSIEAFAHSVFTIVSAESRHAHRSIWPSRYDDFGEDLQELLAIPALDGDSTIAALRAAAEYKQRMRQVFGDVDLLVSPTAPMVAPPIGAQTVELAGMALAVGEAAFFNTMPYNLAHLPAISVPCGFADELPVGLQFAGGPFDDARVLRAAYAYEQATVWHLHRPAP